MERESRLIELCLKEVHQWCRLTRPLKISQLLRRRQSSRVSCKLRSNREPQQPLRLQRQQHHLPRLTRPTSSWEEERRTRDTTLITSTCQPMRPTCSLRPSTPWTSDGKPTSASIKSTTPTTVITATSHSFWRRPIKEKPQSSDREKLSLLLLRRRRSI